MTTKKQLIREYKDMAEIARELLDERDATNAALDLLVEDLLKILPRTSDTVSALARRELTNFTIRRIGYIREGKRWTS